MLYYDARLSASYPTVEIRVADTCTDVDHALVVAGTGPRPGRDPGGRGARPTSSPRSDLLRAAWWRAARYGLSGDLVHPQTWELVPAAEALKALVERVADPLAEAGDTDRVNDGLARLASAGNGARQQRQAFERSGDLHAVVADLVERTAASARE